MVLASVRAEPCGVSQHPSSDGFPVSDEKAKEAKLLEALRENEQGEETTDGRAGEKYSTLSRNPRGAASLF
jgi:hypothetical protein